MRTSILLAMFASGLATPLAAQETRETIAGWTLEERRNPDEPRDYSVVLSRKAGAAELVARRSTVRGREVMLRLDDCTNISFGNDMSSSSLGEQIESIRTNVASSYAESRKECRLPQLSASLLAGLDEAYRAADARYRANRPPPVSRDRSQTVGGWTVEDRRDETERSEPGKRLISMTKAAGGLELRQTLTVNLFFDSLFFTDNAFVARYSDCHRDESLDRLTDEGGPAETAAQRKAIVASLAELEKDCQLPRATTTQLLSDFAPAFNTISGWTRQLVAERASLVAAADAYAARLEGPGEPGDGDAVSATGMNAAEAAADAAAAAAAGCTIDAATGKPDPACAI